MVDRNSIIMLLGGVKMRNLFRIVFKDNDKKTFSYSGLTNDDTRETERCCELIKQGRNVQMHTTESTPEIIEREMKSMGYILDEQTWW